MSKRRVLLVGWDAADWKVARPLMASGEMPNLARLVSGGSSGNLATLSPPFTPMLWTSIATGKRPTKHGIHGFTEPTPDGMRVQAITTLGRKTKAIWNILNQNAVRPSVVGWWPSHPAEPINGVMVSNHYHQAGSGKSASPLLPLSVHPLNWHGRLEELRVVPMDLPGEIIRLFVPEYDKLDQQKDKRLHTLGIIIAETMSIHAAATEVLEHADWDFAAIYYDGIDHFSHGFMNFHPPKLPWVKDEDFAIFQHVIANAYRYHDAMLGRLLQLAGPDTTVIVLSDHGFHPDVQRPGYIPAEVAGPSIEHRHFGMFTIHGPGIKAGGTLYGSSVLDVAPTILHLFGLPVGRDMDGKVLATAFADAGEFKAIDTWDTVDGDAGTHPPGAQIDAVASAEAMKQLVALGYIAPPGGDIAKAVADTITELKYNLARAHADAGEWDDAVRLFEDLHAGDSGDQRYIDHAISAMIVTGRRTKARQMLDDFDTRVETTAPEAEADLKRRREEKPDEELKPLTDMKDQRESFERRILAERSSGFALLRLMLRLRIDVAEEKFDDARRDLEALEALYANATAVPAMLFARAYTQLKDDDRALAWIGKALERDPENWEALAFAARIHLRNRRFAAAADAALLSLSLIYFQPITHYVLGRCLMARKDDINAEQALKTALNQLAGLVPAHNALARLYERQHKYTHASVHRRKASELLEARKQHSRSKSKPIPTPPAGPTPLEERLGTIPADPVRDVIIVAGLPRSGTSMLMQMLAAGGIKPLTDGQRVLDSDNPYGYFEFEPATRLGSDASWLPQARGKAVKLALPLLTRLPSGESYRILIIDRDPGEVIASQRAMLERLGRTGASLDDNALAAEYLRQRERVVHWLARRPEVAVLPLRYDAILSNPHNAANHIAWFLGVTLDVSAAAEAVDPQLRRQASAS